MGREVGLELLARPASGLELNAGLGGLLSFADSEAVGGATSEPAGGDWAGACDDAGCGTAEGCAAVR